MIAKNEEQWIEQCINSVASIIAEVILVDTGSTDSTIERAAALGAKVLHRKWDDDFSAPRNLSLQHATSDWILVLDADEVIAVRDLPRVREHTLNVEHCYEFMQRHYSNDLRISGYKPVRGEYPEWEQNHHGYFESSLCRLFPNGKGIHYQGRVHELVEHSIRQRNQHRIILSPVPLHHYGHTEEVKVKKNKSSIYTPLGTQKLGDQPQNWKAFFELGVEHNNSGKLEESADAFKKALELNPTYVQSWINIGYVFCELARYQDAELSLQTALKIDPKSYEAACNLGVVYLRVKQFQHAEAQFRLAISLNPEYVNAYCNLGKSLACMNRVSEAVNIFQRAIEILPQCVTAKLDIAALYLNAKLPKPAVFYLQSAKSDGSSDERVSTYLKIAQEMKARE